MREEKMEGKYLLDTLKNMPVAVLQDKLDISCQTCHKLKKGINVSVPLHELLILLETLMRGERT